MRFSIVFTLAAAVVSVSASLFARQSPSVPNCYLTCAANEPTGNCSATDAGCLCKNSAFVEGTTACIRKTCQGADLQAALDAGNESCLAVGVTLSSVAAESTGASSASSTGIGSVSSTRAGTTPTSSASSSTSSSAPATTSSSAATAHGANAFIGFAAMGFGLVAFAL